MQNSKLLDASESKLKNKIRNFNETWPFTVPLPKKSWVKEKAVEIEGKANSTSSEITDDVQSQDHMRKVIWDLKSRNIHLSGKYKTWTDEDAFLYTIARAEKDYAITSKILSEVFSSN